MYEWCEEHFLLVLVFVYYSKMTNFLLSQHLFDDDVVELVPSFYAQQVHGHVFALVRGAVSFRVEDWVEKWPVDSDER